MIWYTMEHVLWLFIGCFMYISIAHGERTLSLTGPDSSPTLVCGGVDLVFLVDTSRSIWDLDFKRQLDFVEKVVQKFDIGDGPKQTRVGLLTYAHTFWIRFYLRTYKNIKDLKAAIRRIPHKSGRNTRTEKPLRFLRTHMFKPFYGGRKNVSHVAILISDGQSQNKVDTRMEAYKVKQAGVKIFTIGVGRRADINELKEIASDPDEHFVFQVDNFKALDSINYKLPTSTCAAGKVTTKRPHTRTVRITTTTTTRPQTSPTTPPTIPPTTRPQTSSTTPPKIPPTSRPQTSSTTPPKIPPTTRPQTSPTTPPTIPPTTRPQTSSTTPPKIPPTSKLHTSSTTPPKIPPTSKPQTSSTTPPTIPSTTTPPTIPPTTRPQTSPTTPPKIPPTSKPQTSSTTPPTIPPTSKPQTSSTTPPTIPSTTTPPTIPPVLLLQPVTYVTLNELNKNRNKSESSIPTSKTTDESIQNGASNEAESGTNGTSDELNTNADHLKDGIDSLMTILQSGSQQQSQNIVIGSDAENIGTTETPTVTIDNTFIEIENKINAIENGRNEHASQVNSIIDLDDKTDQDEIAEDENEREIENTFVLSSNQNNQNQVTTQPHQGLLTLPNNIFHENPENHPNVDHHFNLNPIEESYTMSPLKGSQQTTTVSNEILHGLAAYSLKPITEDQAQIMSNYILRDVPAQTYCDGKDADIYFVLDASNSIWPEHFKVQLAFVNSVIDILDVTHGNTRVGVIVYSTQIHPIVLIDSGMSRSQIKRQINNIQYVSGRTNTSDALRFIRQYGFSKLRTREVAVKLAIVLTDGISRQPLVTKRESNLCREAGIHLFAVGIGKKVDKTELKRIANDPDHKFMFHVDSFGALNSIKDFLAITACSVAPDQPQNYQVCSDIGPMDVLFSYDSFALGSRKSQMINFFIHDILNSLEFSNGNLQIGRVTDNCPESTDIPISAAINISDFASTPTPGVASLLRRMKSGFSNREDAKKLGVIFVDDSTENIEQAITIIKEGIDFKLMVIGIGDQQMTEPAGDLCSYPKHDYFLQVPKYSSLLRARSKLLDKICTTMTAFG